MNYEIEFKNMLTSKEFSYLLDYFKLSFSDATRQVNTYFDTFNRCLRANSCALRIREKLGTFEFTLKERTKNNAEHLEIVQMISKKQYEALLTGVIPQGEVYNYLQKITPHLDPIAKIGKLTTDRIEISYLGGLLVLDRSQYLNVTDFELEYEVNDYVLGLEKFGDLLRFHRIPLRPAKNKIQRLLEVAREL